MIKFNFIFIRIQKLSVISLHVHTQSQRILSIEMDILFLPGGQTSLLNMR